MNQNPYAPPADDRPPGALATRDDGFVEGGRGVEAGRGFSWITDGWEIVKGSIGMWILTCILYFVLAVLVSIVPYVGQLGFAVISPCILGGLYIGCQDTREGREFGVGHLFEGFREAGGLLVIGLVHVAWSLVMGGIGLVVGAGGVFNRPKLGPLGPLFGGGHMAAVPLMPLFLFIGISFFLGIPIYMATYYAPALVALRRMTPAEALKNSFLAATKNVLPFIVYCILMVVFSVLAALPCFLGFLVLGPVLIASVYAGYRDVFFTRGL